MEKLKKRRSTQRRFFTLAFKEADAISKQKQISNDAKVQLEAKVEILDSIILEIAELDKQIENLWLDDEEASESTMDKELTEAFMKLSQCKEQVRALKSFLTVQPNRSAELPDSKQHFSKLPKMNLPRFDGTLTQYKHFRERFDSAVGNNIHISEVDKLDYLLGQLDGMAKDAVIGIPCTEANYNVVLKILEENFGQPRKIIRAHVLNILNAPKPQLTASSLRQFYNQVMGDLRCLGTMQVSISESASFIIPILEEKLPKQFREKMGDCNQQNSFNFELFMGEFSKQLQNLEETTNEKKPRPTSSVQNVENASVPTSPDTPISTTATFVGTVKASVCPFCKDSHKAVNCPLSVQDRQKVVREKKLCLNCLHYSHFIKDCLSKGTCFHCKQRHHSALHGSEFCKKRTTYPVSDQSKNTNTSAKVTAGVTTNCSISFSSNENLRETESTNASSNISEEDEPSEIVFVKTAQASVEYCGRTVNQANIFIDEGSQRSYITRHLAHSLEIIPYSKQEMIVHGFGGHSSRKTYDVARIGVVTHEGVQDIDVLITDEIVHPIDQTGWNQYVSKTRVQEFQLADQYDQNEFVVDILIGVDQVWLFMSEHVFKSDEGPSIQMSSLGALLSGSVQYKSQDPHDSAVRSSHCHLQIHNPIHYDNERFCDIQYGSVEYDRHERDFSVSEYQSKIEFRHGQYFVPLPWKSEHPELPPNLNICRNRLTQVTERLDKLGLMPAYCKVMKENLDMGYIEEIQANESPWSVTESHFLPHFFVLRDSETTPLRIVFAANTGSTSLNDCLSTGPCLLNDLVKLLHSFRVKKYGIIADIARAFLSVKLLESDRNYTKFLWFKDNDPKKEIVVYRCTTVVFGHTSSPFSLGATLDLHLSKYSSYIAEDLKNKLYVDNYVLSVYKCDL